jgi:hypothetical protein
MAACKPLGFVFTVNITSHNHIVQRETCRAGRTSISSACRVKLDLPDQNATCVSSTDLQCCLREGFCLTDEIVIAVVSERDLKIVASHQVVICVIELNRIHTMAEAQHDATTVVIPVR